MGHACHPLQGTGDIVEGEVEGLWESKDWEWRERGRGSKQRGSRGGEGLEGRKQRGVGEVGWGGME